jgi:hypothetical protein
MLDQAFDTTKAGGIPEKFHPRSHRDGLLSSALHRNRKHPSKVAHLG